MSRIPVGTYALTACATKLNCGYANGSLTKGDTVSPVVVIPDPADVVGLVRLKELPLAQ